VYLDASAKPYSSKAAYWNCTTRPVTVTNSGAVTVTGDVAITRTPRSGRLTSTTENEDSDRTVATTALIVTSSPGTNVRSSGGVGRGLGVGGGLPRLPQPTQKSASTMASPMGSAA
jgi:hypothetical protein